MTATTATENAGIGSHDIGQVPGSLSQYSYDSRTGTYTNLNVQLSLASDENPRNRS